MVPLWMGRLLVLPRRGVWEGAALLGGLGLAVEMLCVGGVLRCAVVEMRASGDRSDIFDAWLAKTKRRHHRPTIGLNA